VTAATISLALAALVFLASHFALSHPLRLRLVGALGEAGFILLYSLVAALTLGWMILEDMALTDEFPLWIAPDWWWPIASALMLVASVLLVGAFIRNPAFPRTGAAMKAPPAAKGVFAITRHPMMWAFALWALVHLSLWGTPGNMIFAGAILVLAILGSIGQDRKKARVLGRPWLDWQAKTSFIPFAALLAGRARWRDAGPGWIASLGGLVLWLAIVTDHAPTVSPIVLIWQSFL
jgi:uncharacterized membrane protein